MSRFPKKSGTASRNRYFNPRNQRRSIMTRMMRMPSARRISRLRARKSIIVMTASVRPRLRTNSRSASVADKSTTSSGWLFLNESCICVRFRSSSMGTNAIIFDPYFCRYSTPSSQALFAVMTKGAVIAGRAALGFDPKTTIDSGAAIFIVSHARYAPHLLS